MAVLIFRPLRMSYFMLVNAIRVSQGRKRDRGGVRERQRLTLETFDFSALLVDEDHLAYAF